MSKWRGYVTIGFTDPAKLASEIDACFEQQEFAALEVEPARIFNAAGSARRPVEVWNKNRSHVQADNECKDYQYQNEAAYVRNYAGEPDEVRLSGGYQSQVIGQSISNVLVRSVLGGGELGAPVDEIPLFVGEMPPPGATYLDGGLSCDKVLQAINGVSVPHFTFASDSGVIVKAHSSLNRVVIDVNGDGLTYCPGEVANQTVDCLPASKDYCGPAAGTITQCPGAPDDKGGYLDTVDQNSGLVQIQVGGGSIDLNAIYGTCDYIKEPEGWRLTAANPAFNARCTPPLIGGYLGQTITMRSISQAAEQPWFVRNGSFSSDSQHWLATAESSQRATSSTIFDGVPYMQLVNGELKQPLIPIDNRLLRVQALYTSTAAVTVTVVNDRTGLSLLVYTVPSSSTEAVMLSDFFTGMLTDVTLKFSTAGNLKITEIGLIPWQ